MSDQQPIGYLMGLPIYETEMPDAGEIAFGEFTEEVAQRMAEQRAAEQIARPGMMTANEVRRLQEQERA